MIAYVIPAEQAPAEEELRDFCRQRLADFKVPRRFVIATDLPRGPTGKILKRALRRMAVAGVTNPACAGPT